MKTFLIGVIGVGVLMEIWYRIDTFIKNRRRRRLEEEARLRDSTGFIDDNEPEETAPIITPVNSSSNAISPALTTPPLAYEANKISNNPVPVQRRVL